MKSCEQIWSSSTSSQRWSCSFGRAAFALAILLTHVTCAVRLPSLHSWPHYVFLLSVADRYPSHNSSRGSVSSVSSTAIPYQPEYGPANDEERNKAKKIEAVELETVDFIDIEPMCVLGEDIERRELYDASQHCKNADRNGSQRSLKGEFSHVASHNLEEIAEYESVRSNRDNRIERFDQGLHEYYAKYDRKVLDLLQKYRGRFVCVNSSLFPHCEFYICGTIHGAKNSSEMVKEAIKLTCPQYVVLELCHGRVSGLDDSEASTVDMNMTFGSVVKAAIKERSFKTLGMDLLAWMQVKASKAMGSKIGGEFSVAAREAYVKGATVILGDRLYSVTVQRIFDALGYVERLQFVIMLIWETLTTSVITIREFVSKSESEEDFIKNEVSSFTRHMPALANVVVSERDEYLAQTLMEIAKVGFDHLPPPGVKYHRKGKILAVVGVGHLDGIFRCLMKGEIAKDRLKEISSSSKHNATWKVQAVDLAAVYNRKVNSFPR